LSFYVVKLFPNDEINHSIDHKYILIRIFVNRGSVYSTLPKQNHLHVFHIIRTSLLPFFVRNDAFFWHLLAVNVNNYARSPNPVSKQDPNGPIYTFHNWPEISLLHCIPNNFHTILLSKLKWVLFHVIIPALGWVVLSPIPLKSLSRHHTKQILTGSFRLQIHFFCSPGLTGVSYSLK